MEADGSRRCREKLTGNGGAISPYSRRLWPVKDGR